MRFLLYAFLAARRRSQAMNPAPAPRASMEAGSGTQFGGGGMQPWPPVVPPLWPPLLP